MIQHVGSVVVSVAADLCGAGSIIDSMLLDRQGYGNDVSGSPILERKVLALSLYMNGFFDFVFLWCVDFYFLLIYIQFCTYIFSCAALDFLLTFLFSECGRDVALYCSKSG